jgi:ABC-type uncharacterized transport system substrate-binding protein
MILKKRNSYTNFYLLLLILLLLTISCSSQNQIKNTAKIKYVSLDIMTPIDVSCKDFEDSFGKQVKILSINSEKEIFYLKKCIKQLVKDDTVKSADIRIKIEINNYDTTDVICLDRFHIYRNGQFYKMDPGLMQFLNEKIEKN